MIYGFFGDLFRFNEEFYVFLGGTNEIVYAAKIINPEKVRMITALNNERSSRPDAYKSDGNGLYWYVVLTTEDFIDHAAHFGNTQQDSAKVAYFDMLGKRLKTLT
jgi:hypothetical protein